MDGQVALSIHSFTGEGWEIRLGVLDGRSAEVIAEWTSFPAGFDFGWVTREDG